MGRRTEWEYGKVRFFQMPSQPANDLVGCPTGCLFNIFDDPGEHDDKKLQYPKLFAKLMDRLAFYGKTVFQTNYTNAHSVFLQSRLIEPIMVF